MKVWLDEGTGEWRQVDLQRAMLWICNSARQQHDIPPGQLDFKTGNYAIWESKILAVVVEFTMTGYWEGDIHFESAERPEGWMARYRVSKTDPRYPSPVIPKVL